MCSTRGQLTACWPKSQQETPRRITIQQPPVVSGQDPAPALWTLCMQASQAERRSASYGALAHAQKQRHHVAKHTCAHSADQPRRGVSSSTRTTLQPSSGLQISRQTAGAAAAASRSASTKAADALAPAPNEAVQKGEIRRPRESSPSAALPARDSARPSPSLPPEG